MKNEIQYEDLFNGRFFNKEMRLIMSKQESLIEDGIHRACFKLGLEIDEQQLKRWLKLCMKLDNITTDEQVNLAVRFKFQENEKEIARLNRIIIQKNEIIEELSGEDYEE